MALQVNSPIAPLAFGSLHLSSNILYSPLAGCSDFPFRKMSARYHPGLLYCEMVKMDSLVRLDSATFRFLDFDRSMWPIGAQLCGSKPKLVGLAARMIEELGFATVDLNCGCPVDKVTKDGSGSALLKSPSLIGELLAEMVAAVRIPVTVKIRMGWDEDSICAEEIVRLAEAAGAVAIFVHGRTAKQGYRGNANWEIIKACKEAANSIRVIGNGDIFDAEAALRMFEETGCDGVLVSRGTLGQPWIAEDIRNLAAGKPVHKRSLEEIRQELLDHVNWIESYRSGRGAVVDVRRVGCWYFKKSQGTKEFRRAIARVESLEEAREIIVHFGS